MKRDGPLAFFDLSAAQTHSHRGIGRYLGSLIEAFGSIGALDSVVTTNPNFRSVVPIVHTPVVSSRRNDRVATGQLLLGTIFDLTPLRFPVDVFRPWQLTRIKEYSGQLRAMRHCAHLVAISESTARDAKRFLRVDGARITVISPGVSRAFSVSSPSRSRSASKPRILYVGAASRHKNLPRLLEAHALVVRRDAELVVAGLVTSRQAKRLDALATRLGTSDRVFLVGPVGDEELLRLYASADVLALPSLWEGFGLPALEAMAAGLPVVCSDRSSPPEVVGACGQKVDPTSAADIARALDLVLRDATVAAQMSRCGVARASEFTWERSARAHVDLYRSLARSA